MRIRNVPGLVAGSLLTILILLMIYPFYFMMQTSLKDNTQFVQQFWVPAPPYHLSNYGEAFPIIIHYMLNSVIVVGVAALGVLMVATLAAYPFARMRFVGREWLYRALIAMMMVPPVLTLVPEFILIRQFNLIGNYAGVILPYIATGEILGIFILRAFFAALPEELFESARIDGAAEWQIFLFIALPMVRPALASIAILQVLTNWNDYVWPLLVLTDDSVKTLVLGLTAFQTHYITEYGPQMAGYTLSAIPLLLLFAFGMRQFVSGLTAGALKL
jgi:multiple sugar transport system permease protein/raffinose/stachyose/melibiose transport system permease protein